MADDNTIIEGTVKFRDGKKWKSRWCVMRKLSPVADCVHLQLYRDSKARCGGAGCKASLSLQHYLGSESGFTLDKHSNTLALVCRDLVAIIAFETRERLIQWQVKVSAHLGEARHYLVLVGGAGAAGGAGSGGRGRLPAGPARLHLHERRFALTAGVPPRLLGIWELPHLRRYGVVDGRFCFEGGSHCGKGEGLHVLITDQAKEIARDFDLASQGRLSPKRRPNNFMKNDGRESPKSHKAYRPDTRLSELNTIDQSLPPIDLHNYEETGEEAGGISPYWPSAERRHCDDMGLGDTTSVHEAEAVPTWGGNVTLERCMSCMSKLGALSRSSTAALTPGAKHFSPAWTMEPVREAPPVSSMLLPSHCDSVPSTTDKTDEACRCPARSDRPPERPPKPTHLELNLNRKPTPLCHCAHSAPDDKPNRVGPYENYDVPKVPCQELDGEYYDTPKRLKECLNSELFKVTTSSNSNAVILKKPCGCLLKFGKRRREPTIIDSEENFQPNNCPCQRVTDWANTWIKLPYCRKSTVSSDNLVPNKENLIPNSDRSALYATIDLSRKTRRRQRPGDTEVSLSDHDGDATRSRQLNGQSVDIDDGPLANYENLNFALSLEHYENAKDLLRRVGVTQSELDAISANLKPPSFATVDGERVCTKCGHLQKHRNSEANQDSLTVSTNGDYLLMGPNATNKLEQSKPPPAGYTPMSPIGGFAFNTLKHPAKSPINRLLEEKSASNPTLCAPEESRRTNTAEVDQVRTQRNKDERPDKIEYRKRSSSADSSRFLEDVKEFEGSIGSHGSTSSIETLRNLALDVERTSTPCQCTTDSKHSDADSSEASKGARGRSPPAKRSSSVPGKAGGNRDSSSSNDSGVSVCSLRRGSVFELPLTTAAARRHYRSVRRAASGAPPPRARRCRSSDPLCDPDQHSYRDHTKSSSAEAEVPVLSIKPLRGVADTHSTSSGTSDMSDYIETLSICSSHSSTDTPITMRVMRQTTSTLRPRSGKEYGNLDPRLASAYRAPSQPPHHPHHPNLYTNLP